VNFFLLADGGYPPYGPRLSHDKMVAEKPDGGGTLREASSGRLARLHQRNPAPGKRPDQNRQPKMTDGQIGLRSRNSAEQALDGGDATPVVSIITAERYKRPTISWSQPGWLDPKTDGKRASMRSSCKDLKWVQ